MRVGLSFSRCILDIVRSKVLIDDVLIIIARTKLDPNVDTEWDPVWQGYAHGTSVWTHPEWYNAVQHDGYTEDQFRAVACQLYNDGKIHQPRNFGAHAIRMPYYWLETILPNEELDSHPSVKSAWDKFKTIAELSGIHVEGDHT